MYKNCLKEQQRKKIKRSPLRRPSQSKARPSQQKHPKLQRKNNPKIKPKDYLSMVIDMNLKKKTNIQSPRKKSTQVKSPLKKATKQEKTTIPNCPQIRQRGNKKYSKKQEDKNYLKSLNRVGINESSVLQLQIEKYEDEWFMMSSQSSLEVGQQSSFEFDELCHRFQLLSRQLQLNPPSLNSYQTENDNFSVSANTFFENTFEDNIEAVRSNDSSSLITDEIIENNTISDVFTIFSSGDSDQLYFSFQLNDKCPVILAKSVTQQKSCSICLGQIEENQQIRKLPCSHTFHRGCIDPWFKTKLTCPFCRSRLYPETKHDFQSSLYM